MKILVAHSRYQRPGGEDVIFDAETALLEGRGHQVVRYTEDNRDARQYTTVSLAARTVWNTATSRRLRGLIRRIRPDVLHVHNTFPLISPSIYSTAQSEGVPVVQTLHNFRLVCPGALLLRDGKVCEECLGTATRWPAVVHACYRNSHLASGVISAMLSVHTLAGTWAHKVDRYIAPSEFARTRFVRGGIPPDKLVVKPNFLNADPGMRTGHGDYALFVGRLSPEKGLGTLLDALRLLSTRAPRLKIVGNGPLMTDARAADPRVEWLGHQSREQVFECMRHAAMLIVPSESYETSPLTIIEAFAIGLPVIATRLGTMAEMVSDGRTGLLFEPRSAGDLARVIERATSHPDEMELFARSARVEFERKYTAERNYQSLMTIYESAMRPRGRVSLVSAQTSSTTSSVTHV